MSVNFIQLTDIKNAYFSYAFQSPDQWILWILFQIAEIVYEFGFLNWIELYDDDDVDTKTMRVHRKYFVCDWYFITEIDYDMSSRHPYHYWNLWSTAIWIPMRVNEWLGLVQFK